MKKNAKDEQWRKRYDCPETFVRVGKQGFKGAFAAWVIAQEKQTKESLHLNVVHTWPKFMKGAPVSRAFADYVRRFLWSIGRKYKLEEIAEPCKDEQAYSRIRDLLGGKASFWGIVDLLGRGFRIRQSSYMLNDDFMAAAELILHCWGKSRNNRLSRKGAIASGEKGMRRSVEEYALCMKSCVFIHRKSILMARAKVHGVVQTVGLCWMIPLTDECFERMRSGISEDIDLRPEDMLPRSRNLLVGFYLNQEVNRRSDRAIRSLAVMKTAMYQLAAMTAGLSPNEKSNVRGLIMVGALLSSEDWAKSYGFRATGALSPHSGRAVMMLERPVPDMRGAIFKTDREFKRAWREYRFMLFLASIFRGMTRARKP